MTPSFESRFDPTETERGRNRIELSPEDAAFDEEHCALMRELWEGDSSASELILAKLEAEGLYEGGTIQRHGREVTVERVEELVRERPQARAGVRLPGPPAVRTGYWYQLSDGSEITTPLGSDERLHQFIREGVSVGEYSPERLRALRESCKTPMPPPNLAEAFGVGAAAEQDPAVYCEGMRALGGSIDAALSYLMHTEHVGPREMAAFAETQELPAAQAAFLRFFCERARQMRMSTQILAERLQRDPDTQRVVLRELFQTEHEELSGPVRIEDEGFGVAVCFDGEDDYLSAYAGYVRATREEHEQVRESVRDTAGLATLGNLVPLSGPLRHMRGYVTFNLVGGDLGGEQMRIREHERQHKLNSLLLPEREITSLRKEGTPQTVAQAKDEIVAHLREGLSREAIIERLAVRNHPLYSYWRVPIDEARAHGCEEQAVHLEALEAEHIETVERLIEMASRAQAQGTTLTTLALTPWSRWRDLITEDTSTESTYN